MRIAVSRKHAAFLDRHPIAHAVLPDIQEADGRLAPGWEWLRSIDRIRSRIQAEYLDGFFRLAGRKIGRAAAHFGVPAERFLLEGRRT